MNISLMGSNTCTFGELVEGEAFMHEGTIWILCTIDSHTIDLDYTIDQAHLLAVSKSGLIPRTYALDSIAHWQVQPLEITDLSFSPSTIGKADRQYM